MKLTKEQTQKIVLGGMMLCGVVYAYIEFALAPLTASREAARKGIENLDPQIHDAQTQIARTRALEAREPASRLLLDQVNAMTPGGSPIAWFPPKVAELFKKEGVEKVGVRIVNELPEKEIAGFARISWAADIPRADFLTFASAVSALENGEPLVEVQGFEIEAGRDDVQNQRISLSLVNFVRL
jgi:hypothetical protein